MSGFSDSYENFDSYDDDDDSDLADEAEFDDEEEPTVKCGNCGYEMLEIAFQCPRCGEVPTREFQKTTNQPPWVVLTALVLLFVLLWLAF